MKTFTLWILILVSGAAAAYLGLIALFTIGVGFGHTHQQGFWVPILTGCVSLIIIFFLLFKVLRALLKLIALDKPIEI